MSSHQQYQRVFPIGGFDHAYVSAPVGVDTQIGVAGRGQFLDSVLVGEPGSSAVLTVKDGANVVGVFALSASMPVIPFHIACDGGLFYQLSGSGTISLTVVYADYAPI